jgi:hypothetical protein
MKMAVTMFAACALKPPMLPATAEPIRFLEIFTSTRACTVVLRSDLTTSAGTTASQTTDLPRPSILQHHGFVYKTGSWDGLKANFGQTLMRAHYLLIPFNLSLPKWDFCIFIHDFFDYVTIILGYTSHYSVQAKQNS